MVLTSLVPRPSTRAKKVWLHKSKSLGSLRSEFESDQWNHKAMFIEIMQEWKNSCKLTLRWWDTSAFTNYSTCCVPLYSAYQFLLASLQSVTVLWWHSFINLYSYTCNYKAAALLLAQGFKLVTPDIFPLWVGSRNETKYLHLHTRAKFDCLCKFWTFKCTKNDTHSLCSNTKMEGNTHATTPSCVKGIILWYLYSLVPRPFPPPVFDRLQYANMEGEGLEDLVTCGYVR